jgi:hypothetical protein
VGEKESGDGRARGSKAVEMSWGILYKTPTIIMSTTKNFILLFNVFHPKRMTSIGSKTFSLILRRMH